MAQGTIPTKRGLTRKLSMAFAGAAAAGVVVTAGIAGAAPDGKPTKAQCEAAGFTNYGQCVREWAQGRGYANSNNTANNNVNVNVRGNDNVFDVVINNIFH
jgi:hypothetical protein